MPLLHSYETAELQMKLGRLNYNYNPRIRKNKNDFF